MKKLSPVFPAVFSICIAISSTCFSQNLVPSQSWTVGSGSIGAFTENGIDSQNIREMGTGPFGTQTILWKAVADAANGPDGGWNTDHFNIDNTKMYRFAVWIKKSNSTDGQTYFGCYANDILDLSGTVNSNPYFWYGDLPLLDRWYLLVGYVHGSGDASTTSYGGIYDGVTGAKVLSTTDFKFSSSATYAAHRTYLYYDVTTSDRQYFYGPEVYKVDQPLTETIAPSITNGNAFFGGNVGIGTTTPAYSLDVSGTIRSYTNLRTSGITNGTGYFGDDGWGSTIFSITRQPNNETRFQSYGYHTFYSGGNVGNERMRIDANGNVGIGTTNPGSYKLAVEGKIGAREVNVIATNPWPDYVFEKNYKLPSLEEIKNYIDQNQHLPEVPSAKEVEKNGVNLGEMNAVLLKKIEELTLYILKQEARELQLEKKLLQQEERIKSLEAK